MISFPSFAGTPRTTVAAPTPPESQTMEYSKLMQRQKREREKNGRGRTEPGCNDLIYKFCDDN